MCICKILIFKDSNVKIQNFLLLHVGKKKMVNKHEADIAWQEHGFSADEPVETEPCKRQAIAVPVSASCVGHLCLLFRRKLNAPTCSLPSYLICCF